MFKKFSKLKQFFDDEVPSVPLETQLERLAPLGIRLNGGVPKDALLQRFTRQEIEKNPYSMLLAGMGGTYDAGGGAEDGDAENGVFAADVSAGSDVFPASADGSAGETTRPAEQPAPGREAAPAGKAVNEPPSGGEMSHGTTSCGTTPDKAGAAPSVGGTAPGGTAVSSDGGAHPSDDVPADEPAGGRAGQSGDGPSAFAEELEAMRRLRSREGPETEDKEEGPEGGAVAGPGLGSKAEPGSEAEPGPGQEPPDAGRFLPISDDILYLDSDCIEEAGIYSEILRRMGAMTRGEIGFDEISDTLDPERYTASVSFVLGGRKLSFALDVQGSEIDMDFFSRVNEALQNAGTDRRFYLHLAEPEILVIFSDAATVRRLNSLTGVFFELY